MIRSVACVLALLCLPAMAAGQQRPLVTEDPETIGSGNILVEAGLEYGDDIEFPASGLKGDLWRVPLVGVSVGISSIAEVQVDGGFYNHLSITDRDPSAPLADMLDITGDSTSDIQDFSIGLKVRLIKEGVYSPGWGVRFTTRLPNASNESGLGLDTTNFYWSVLGAKTIERLRIVGNLGFAILGDPTRGDRQNDVLTYGASFSRALTPSTEAVAEVNGHVDTREGPPLPGSASRSVVRVGARYTIGAWRADGALLFGLTESDPGFGFAGGFTYVFKAFTIP